MFADDAFLAAIRAHPEEDGPRLVYADWLDEHGRHDRAEFIRAQVALARPRLPGGAARRKELQQREKALLAQLPAEQSVAFRGKDGKFPGIVVSELSADQKAQLQKTVKLVFEPYRNTDRDEVNECLNKQGGLDACSLAFYAQGDIGDDGVWDNWRLEGPSFVWYFRGTPHVHVWVNIADDPSVPLNSKG